MKKALLKDTVKEIKNTFKRFISILAIVLLGVGFFAGIKATSPDMKKTIDQYLDEQNVMDIQVLSTLGLTQDDIEELQKIDAINQVVGTYETDVIVNSKEEDFVIKLITYQKEINGLVLLEGKLPESEKECVVEKAFLAGTGHNIGDNITIVAEDVANDKGEKNPLLKENTVKIVGIVDSPLYISRERGSSKIGSGKINYYMYSNKENWNTEIYTNAYLTVKGAKELACYDNQYEDLIEQAKKQIETIQEERKDARYKQIYDEANGKLQDAQKELEEQTKKAEKELKEAQEKIEDAKKELQKGKQTLQNQKVKANTEFTKAKKQLDQAQTQLNQKETEFTKQKEEAQKQITQAQVQLDNLKKVQENYQQVQTSLTTSQKQLTSLQQELAQLDPNTESEKIQELNVQIAKLQQTILVLQGTLTQIETSLISQGISISTLAGTIQTIQTTINTSNQQLEQGEKFIQNAKKELSKQKEQYEKQKNTTNTQIKQAEAKLKSAENEIKKNETKLKDSKNDLDDKLAEAQEKLEDAKLELQEIKRPEWYILDRNQNVGYASYLQDTDRIGNIAKVFPIIFFVVAALISLTTMTRMVEEERIQIGTLKGLGYNKIQIASKYIIYASLATILGGIIGMAIGFQLIPRIILRMYGMMYTIPNIVIEFNMQYALIGLLTATACTVGATLYSCIKSLLAAPASLMIPKAPKPGKRVFLEKIPFIWSKLNFTKKVTVRNLFRYKKRFLMTIIGVAGCTALIIAGFGLRDAISSMIPSQYGEIFHYNLQVSLKDNLKKQETEEAYQKILEQKEITNTLKAKIQSIEITNIDNNQTIQLIVPEDTQNLENFIKLRNRKQPKETYTLNNQGVIINEKLANLLNIKIGDSITIKNADDVEVEAKVAQITENYLMHYVYMSPELYQNLYEEEMKPNAIFATTNELTKNEEEVLGKTILEDKDRIAGVSFTSGTTDIFKDVMSNMNLVVWILIVSAGLLALVVLYNLSNTNISERIRELATIKVLGFYDKEVYEYVSKETIILTLIGIILGLIGGYFLTIFIIKTCELDMLMFNPKINLMTYLYGIIITAVFAGIVNIETYFALKKIDMIESLKSVE